MAETKGPLHTLDRGLVMLNLVSQAPDGITVSELAELLGVHRAVCYRLASTLAAHGLIVRGADGRLRLGAQMRALADRFVPQLRAAARPVLRDLARACGATAHLSIAEAGECVAVEVVEPPGSVMHVAYRVGSRHPLERGAAGRAILAARPPHPRDPDSVRADRERGFSVTYGELQRGAVGVAAGLDCALGAEASIGVVALSDLDAESTGARVRQAVADLTEFLGRAGEISSRKDADG